MSFFIWDRRVVRIGPALSAKPGKQLQLQWPPHLAPISTELLGRADTRFFQHLHSVHSRSIESYVNEYIHNHSIY